MQFVSHTFSKQTLCTASAVLLSTQAITYPMDTDYEAAWQTSGPHNIQGNGDHLFDPHKLMSTNASTMTTIPSLTSIAYKCVLNSAHLHEMPISLNKDALSFLLVPLSSNDLGINKATYQKLLSNFTINNRENYYAYGRHLLAALLHIHTDPNISVQESGRTFLHIATQHSDTHAIQLLFEDYKANPNITLSSHLPIAYAQTVAIAQLFIAHGLQLPASAPFYHAIMKAEYEPGLLPLYVQHGALMNMQNTDQETLLHSLLQQAAYYTDKQRPALLEKAEYILKLVPELLSMRSVNGQTAIELLHKLQKSTAVPAHVQKHYQALITLLQGYTKQ